MSDARRDPVIGTFTNVVGPVDMRKMQLGDKSLAYLEIDENGKQRMMHFTMYNSCQPGYGLHFKGQTYLFAGNQVTQGTTFDSTHACSTG